MDAGDDREKQKMVKQVETHLKHLISQPVFKNATKIPTGDLCVPPAAPAGMENSSAWVQHRKRKQNLNDPVSQKEKFFRF